MTEVHRAGQELEAGQAQGLTIMLADINQEVLDLRASIEDRYRTEERHIADMHELLGDLEDKSRAAVAMQHRTHRSPERRLHCRSARGKTQTLSLIEAGKLQLPQQRVRYHFTSPTRGLVKGILYRLDVWALQLFEETLVTDEAMQCPMSLFVLYRWHRVRDELPLSSAQFQLCQLCEPPRRKVARTARARNRARFQRRGVSDQESKSITLMATTGTMPPQI